MFSISLCHTLNNTRRTTIRSAFGRLIVGLFIGQKNFATGCIPPTHGFEFTMFQQIALGFSSPVMLGSSESLSLQYGVLLFKTSSVTLQNNWVRGLNQAW